MTPSLVLRLSSLSDERLPLIESSGPEGLDGVDASGVDGVDGAEGSELELSEGDEPPDEESAELLLDPPDELLDPPDELLEPPDELLDEELLDPPEEDPPVLPAKVFEEIAAVVQAVCAIRAS